MNSKPSQKLRAVWAGADANERATIDRMLDRVVRGGFNTVLYHVGSGMVHYNSTLLPQSSSVTPEFDPLAYVVEQGHARGLKVQAWWAVGDAPRNSAFRSRYPEWSIALDEQVDDNIHWLNFSIPEARTFVGNVVLEIAENYDVDGVHLDYIRYAYDCGPSPCHRVFDAEGVSITVRDAYERLKASRPNTLLTAAVMSYGGKWQLQNWSNWLAEGYIDYVMPMAYYDPENTFGEGETLESDIRLWKGFAHPERIMPGLKVYTGEGQNKVPKTPEQLLAQVEMCRACGFRAFSIFNEANITDQILEALSADHK